MATFSSIVTAECRKSIDTVTTYMSGGQNIARKRRTKIKNPKPPKQLAHRANFKAVTGLGKTLADAIAIGLEGERSARYSARNIFVRMNKKVATTVVSMEDEDGEETPVCKTTIDYPSLQLSGNSMQQPDEVTGTLDGTSGVLSIEVKDAESFQAHVSKNDEFLVCVLEKATGACRLYLLGNRSTCANSASEVILPESWNATADNLAVYFFCASKDHKRACKTIYVKLT